MTEKEIYDTQLSKQEVHVLLRALAIANSAEDRDPDSYIEEDRQVRKWLVDRLLRLLPQEELSIPEKF